MKEYWVPTALRVQARNEDEAQSLVYGLMTALVNVNKPSIVDYFTYDIDDETNPVHEA